MRDIMIVVIASLLLGIGASFLTNKYNEGETYAWRKSIEAQLEGMKVIMTAVQANQIELATNRGWRRYMEDESEDFSTRLTILEKTAVTQQEIDAAVGRIEREIELLWAKHDNN